MYAVSSRGINTNPLDESSKVFFPLPRGKQTPQFFLLGLERRGGGGGQGVEISAFVGVLVFTVVWYEGVGRHSIECTRVVEGLRHGGKAKRIQKVEQQYFVMCLGIDNVAAQ